MDSSRIPPKTGRQNSTGSTDSGVSSASSETSVDSKEAFLRETRPTSVDSQLSNQNTDSQLPGPSYKNLQKREVDKFYVAESVGQGWTNNLLELYEQGKTLCAAFNSFNGTLGDIVRDPKCDRALQQLLVLFGNKKIPGALEGGLAQESARDSLRRQMEVVQLHEKWAAIEEYAREVLKYIPMIAAISPLSPREMDEAAIELQKANNDAVQLMNQSSPGGKSKKNKRTKEIVAKQKAASERFLALQKEYYEKVKERVQGLGPFTDKLKEATDQISDHHLKTYLRPCTEAARSDVKVPVVPGEKHKKLAWEVESVSGSLLIGCTNLAPNLEYFAKNYFLFLARGGRAHLLAKQADRLSPKSEAEQASRANQALLDALPKKPESL
ncbi:hypothetical protein [Parendozoicomonas sp. Alg238-R29]|uniref:hypothetical protein n=1 Tax=Parendozoicomonas sp. Alg238-R29 TaxID=2993446 RepID=UPI00248E3C89|nr:hypothetical protein [Parendozoicomonas sp. Alg238-R29]